MTKEEIFSKIPNKWYPIFIRELEKIFTITTPEDLFNAESTGGWRTALGKASTVINEEWITKEWDMLPWYDSDELDDWIADKILEGAGL